jgi:hypothetical protein
MTQRNINISVVNFGVSALVPGVLSDKRRDTSAYYANLLNRYVLSLEYLSYS